MNNSELIPDISRWIDDNKIPINGGKHQYPADDFSPLKSTLKNVTVIGVGEVTHGTRECFDIRLSLLQFLVKEMGFTVLALEAGFSACEAVNDYITAGKGDPKDAIKGLGYSMYQVEEFLAVLLWLKDHNQYCSPSQKVKLFGFDLWPNDAARKNVLSYLERYSPSLLTLADSVMGRLAVEEGLWPSQSLSVDNEVGMASALPELERLIGLMQAREQSLVQASSAGEYSKATKYLSVMKQWLEVNITALIPVSLLAEPAPKSFTKSRCHANNLIEIIHSEAADTKFIIWDHNLHIGVGMPSQEDKVIPNFGYDLREKFGDQYYAIGFEFGSGEYLAREIQADTFMLQGYKVASMATPRQDKLAFYLLVSDKDNYFIDLRDSPINAAVDRVLLSHLNMHCIGWMYHPPDSSYLFKKMSVKCHFDGLLFIANSNATTPFNAQPAEGSL